MSDLSTITVLLVDDEPDIVDLLALMLRPFKARIVKAFNGATAFEIINRQPPDIIITDLMMPEMDGFELMKAVQEHYPQLPIIVSTAYGSMDVAIKALRLGAFDFIPKPLDAVTIRNTINKAIDIQLNRKQEALQQQVYRRLSGIREPEKAADIFLTLIAEAFNADYATLIWATDKPSLSLAANTPEMTFSLTDWANAGPLRTPNNNDEIIIASDVAFPAIDFQGALLGFNLVCNQVPLATVVLGHTQRNYFKSKDGQFLDYILPFISLAFQNAQIYASLQNSNQRLSTLQSISALTYNAQLSLHRVLRLSAEGIRQNLGASACLIMRPDPAGSHLALQAAAGNYDKFLRRRGDVPTNPIYVPIADNNPFAQALQQKKVQITPIEAWIETYQRNRQPAVAGALSRLKGLQGICVPIWHGQNVIGILAVGIKQTSPNIDPEDITLFTNIANQIGLLIANVSLYQAEQQGRREMAALYNAGLTITSSLSREAVLRTIVETIIDLTQMDGCIIGQWRPAKREAVIDLHLSHTAKGLQEEQRDVISPLHNRPTIEKALTTQTMQIVTPQSENLHPAEADWLAKMTIKRWIITPLVIRETSIGMMELISTSDDTPFNDTTIRIVKGLAAQAAIAIDNARLHESEVKRLEHEMDLARRIQLSLLPQTNPEIPGLSIAARSQSARMVGGDFYRYLLLPNHQFGLVVGDVSGKGVPSALFMGIATTAMDTQQIRGLTAPGDMLAQLNRMLLPRMQQNKMNCALQIGIYDQHAQTLQVANAGMIAPLRKENGHCDWVEVGGFPIGSFPDMTYQTTSIDLSTRPMIIIASDGIIEAMNSMDDLYGFDRFQAAVDALPASATSQQVLDILWDDVVQFIQDADQHDDMTLMVLQTTTPIN